MSSREVPQKPFTKRAHRPWENELWGEADEAQKTIPIVADEAMSVTPQPGSSTEKEKGKMLIGGFFKPEGLQPGYLDSLATTEESPSIGQQVEQLIQSAETQVQSVSSPPIVAEASLSTLEDTEVLLQTLLKVKKDVSKTLTQQNQSAIQALQDRIHTLEDACKLAKQDRLVAEEKLAKLLQEIQKQEDKRHLESQKRRQVESRIKAVIKESEALKRSTEQAIKEAETQRELEKQARIAAEKITQDALNQVAQYQSIVKEAEIISEKYEQQTDKLLNEEHLRKQAEALVDSLKNQLKVSEAAQLYAEEQYCNLKLEIEAERQALSAQAEALDQSILTKTEAMKKIVEKEKDLRLILEEKLAKLVQKYLNLEKTVSSERAARLQAEARAKEALEKASKAVLHMLSVGGNTA